MGMSCTAEQSETMEKLFKAEHAQVNWGRAGSYAFDGYVPNRDYGYPPHVNLTLTVLRMADNNHAYVAGKAKIAPDGSFTMPALARKAMGL